ncbi:hypothetical protein TNCV_1084111 [Trichonephila clavipes]|nr:hypothetical protein TNCV_1084111 [Trichonephila clavipes]
MDDNATIYRAKSVQNWFAEHQSDSHTSLIPWPPHRLRDVLRLLEALGLHRKMLRLICRLDGVFGLLLVFCTEGCGFDHDPNQWIFLMQKIDTGHVNQFSVTVSLFAFTSAFSDAIAANSSGTTFFEGPSGDSPFLPEPFQLR